MTKIVNISWSTEQTLTEQRPLDSLLDNESYHHLITVFYNGLDSLLELKLWHLKVIPCLYREAMLLQYLMPTCYVKGCGYVRTSTWRTLPDLLKIVWPCSYTVAIYPGPIHCGIHWKASWENMEYRGCTSIVTLCDVFWTVFFLHSVWFPRYKNVTLSQ